MCNSLPFVKGNATFEAHHFGRCSLANICYVRDAKGMNIFDTPNDRWDDGPGVGPYSPVIHFARSISPTSWRSARIAMFRAYVDESGTDNASGCIGVGGLIADVEAWWRFEIEWRRILSEAGVKYSHMKEYAHSAGEFSKWKSKTKEFEPQREKFMQQVCDCITKTAIYTFGAIIAKSEYEKFVPEDLRQDMGAPYAFLGRYCIARVGVWAQENSYEEPVNLIFERGQPQTTIRVQHKILMAHEQARKQFRIGALSFMDKYIGEHPEDSVLPLQAADVVAYELVKHWNTFQASQERLVQPANATGVRYPLKRLMELPRDWNKLTSVDFKREVSVWKTVRDYARASIMRYH